MQCTMKQLGFASCLVVLILGLGMASLAREDARLDAEKISVAAGTKATVTKE
jgi:hypothetical protein